MIKQILLISILLISVYFSYLKINTQFFKVRENNRPIIIEEGASDEETAREEELEWEENQRVEKCDYFLDDKCLESCIRQSNQTTVYPKKREDISNHPVCHKCPYYPRGIVSDPLFAYIQKQHNNYLSKNNKSHWGRVLDSGTGISSFKFLKKQKRSGLIGVTASEDMRASMLSSLSLKDGVDQLVLGHWRNDSLLKGEEFDVILSDYLIGSIDHFDRYFQPMMLDRLHSLLKKNERIYFVGLEPFLEKTNSATSQILLDVVKIRESSQIWASETPYREFPGEWLIDQLTKSGFKVLKVKYFPIVFGSSWVVGQADILNYKLENFPGDNALKSSYINLAQKVKKRAKRNLQLSKYGHCYGFDYVIIATKE